MSWIVSKRKISENITKIEIEAAGIVSTYQPGQHVIVTVNENTKPVPFVISGINECKGTITLLLQHNELEHLPLSALLVGDEVHKIEGPFGETIPTESHGTVICAAETNGFLAIFPVVKNMKAAGNKVITILAASTKSEIVLEKEFNKYSDALIITTEDGSNNITGNINTAIQAALVSEKATQIIMFGSFINIKSIWQTARRLGISFKAVLYAPIVTNNGLGGIYTVSMCSNSSFIAVDGENFNAYYPDFDTMAERMKFFFNLEQIKQLELRSLA
jgi:NAD(P)H-flavin reductase